MWPWFMGKTSKEIKQISQIIEEQKKVYKQSSNDGLFERVPNPIFAYIISFLNLKELAQLAQTNHRLHDVIEKTSYSKFRNEISKLQPLKIKISDAEKKIEHIEIITKMPDSLGLGLIHSIGLLLYLLAPGAGAGLLIGFLLADTLGSATFAVGCAVGVSLTLSNTGVTMFTLKKLNNKAETIKMEEHKILNEIIVIEEEAKAVLKI